MARWRRELPGAEDAYVTVNLSVHQLSDATLLESIAEALADSGLPPEALVLEVTETLLMSDTAETVDALNGIHAMGVGLAIDDFGTGESSLTRLKSFPVKVLKIDKSFVDGLGILETDEAIVAAIVQLSKALGIVVLAEGVETPAQLERVAALGCDLYQGYLMSRPISADQRRLLQDGGDHPADRPPRVAACCGTRYAGRARTAPGGRRVAVGQGARVRRQPSRSMMVALA